jgi:tetratricopeptide (TPR) repeat protein
LLLHTRRYNDAESHLQQALALSPDLPMAEASFGMLRVRQGRLADARQYLEKAVAGNSQNYLAHFYYAYALSGLSFEGMQVVHSYSSEVAASMRAELRKVLALKSDFAEAYAMLGFINVVRNEEIDETIALLKRALTMSRSNQRVIFMLAQLYMRKENFSEARQLLEPLARNSPDPDLRQHAQSLLEGVTRTEERIAQGKALEKEATARLDELQRRRPTQTDGNSVMLPGSGPPDENSILLEALRKPRDGETRIQGVLTSIECNAKGITFKVRAGNRLLQFHSDNFERIDITAFTQAVTGEIVCGPRKTENPVVITYAAARAGSKVDGEANAIEFVPGNFVLKQ